MNLTEEEKNLLLKVLQEQIDLFEYLSRGEYFVDPAKVNTIVALKEIQKKVKLCD